MLPTLSSRLPVFPSQECIVNHQHRHQHPRPAGGDCTNVLFEQRKVTRVFFPQILIYLGWNLTPPPVFVIKIVIFYKVRMTGQW